MMQISTHNIFIKFCLLIFLLSLSGSVLGQDELAGNFEMPIYTNISWAETPISVNSSDYFLAAKKNEDPNLKTVSSGSWIDGSSWYSGTSPSTIVSVDKKNFITVVAGHKIVLGTDEEDQSLTISSGTLAVEGTFVIHGNLFLEEDANLEIGENGILIVFGSVQSTKKVEVLANGVFIVQDNFEVVPGTGNGGGGASFESVDDLAQVYIGGTVTVPDKFDMSVLEDNDSPHTDSGANYGSLIDLQSEGDVSYLYDEYFQVYAVITAKAFAISCSGANDGVIQFYETTPAIDSGFDFSIDGGVHWQTSSIFTGLSQGDYNLRIRETGGGINSADYPLSVGNASSPTISESSITNENCGEVDGSIDVTVAGGRRGSMQTNGFTGMADLQASFLSSLNAFTMEGCMKMNADRSAYSSGKKKVSFFGQNNVIEFGINAGNISCWTAKGETVTSALSNYPDDQKWHHVAVVGSGTSLTLYVDGEIIGTKTQSINPSTYGSDETYNVKIGAGVWNADEQDPFNGFFADVRFWSDARTTTEIQTNMNKTLNGDEDNLIAVYKMDTPPDDDSYVYGIGTGATVGILNSGASLVSTDPVYIYSWTGPDSFVSTDEDLTDLSAGTYELTVTDLNGCSVSESFNVGVDDTTAPVFENTQEDMSVNASDISCGQMVTFDYPIATDKCSAFEGSIDGYTYLGVFNEHTYYYSSASVSISTAMQNAIDEGGNLLAINSQEENDFINNQVGEIWIGINDLAEENTFVWTNGETVDYTNWNSGEPNNSSDEDYVEMLTSGLWNDFNDTHSLRYVIEFQPCYVVQTAGLTSGSTFPVGTTKNTYEATDNAGNTATYSFNVEVTDVTAPEISALTAYYYDGIDFDTLKEEIEVDGDLNYSWSSGAPESSLVGTDYFSVRFKGTVQADKAGTYTFYTTSDDGVRLWVNGDEIINNWTDHASTVNTGTITLSAGQTIPIVLEYYEKGGQAVIKLEWKDPDGNREYVENEGIGACSDITIDISDTGSYTLTADEADPGYTDACGIDTRVLSKTDFTCDDIGENAVTLTVTDVNGNSSECNFNVIVVGNVDASVSLSSDTGTDNQLLCINTGITNITYTVTNETGVTVSGLPAGVSGEYDGGTFTLSGTPSESGAFLYSVIASGVCESDTITGTIIVRALPVTPSIIVSAEDGSINSDNTVCAGNTTTISVDSTHFTDYSMHFDGVDDYLAVSTDSILNYHADLSLERTVMLWFKPEDITSRQVLYKEGNSSAGFVIYIKSDTIYAYGITSGVWSVTNAVLTAPDQWYHFAYTWNHASQLCKAYLNGNLVDTLTEAKIFGKNQTGNSIAGGSNVHFPDVDYKYENDAPIKYYFKGNIDNFKLWTSELSQDQIILELSAVNALVSDVVLDYNFDDYNDRNSSSVANSGSAGSAYIRGPVDKSSIDGPVYESSIVWDDPKNSTTFSINVNPTETTTYTATVSNDDGCDRSVNVELIVNPIPKPIGIFFE
ncbi:LamG-like jellyroll fold domain-containing protein [Ancylomarina sp. 16SWW S1-10-2]|uniref:LamG-like jellyroll fold domain-containing protein n=1 Tax=Ancylomarina sp. 16SWW S1-10-2 TaxID=2499681 RepID=UPI0012AE4456|nr:LamG-like jellyroll fold domain-containing protein [Ancylomarina sp. 16SWW S1-10-2]MRT94526.1 HYR domain-containing protein [Ancylomarina sp. 16SWW S1-10-2]